MGKFIVNVSYETGWCDIDTMSILTDALQETYSGFRDEVILPVYGGELNSHFVNMKCLRQAYDFASYEVSYNKDGRLSFEKDDDRDAVIEFVKKRLSRTTYYKYRSVHSMDREQRTEISIKEITIT